VSRLLVRVLGFDIFEVTTDPDDEGPQAGDRGDCTTTPVGFTAQPGDQRWQPGPDL